MSHFSHGAAKRNIDYMLCHDHNRSSLAQVISPPISSVAVVSMVDLGPRHVIAHQTRRISVDLSDEGVGDTLVSVRPACGDH
jgi:hypothetical protein